MGAIFNHSTCKYDRIVVAPVDDVHIKHIITDNCRLACEGELSSTLQASGRSMPGTDYFSTINDVPGRLKGEPLPRDIFDPLSFMPSRIDILVAVCCGGTEPPSLYPLAGNLWVSGKPEERIANSRE